MFVIVSELESFFYMRFRASMVRCWWCMHAIARLHCPAGFRERDGQPPIASSRVQFNDYCHPFLGVSKHHSTPTEFVAQTPLAAKATNRSTRTHYRRYYHRFGSISHRKFSLNWCLIVVYVLGHICGRMSARRWTQVVQRASHSSQLRFVRNGYCMRRRTCNTNVKLGMET